MQRRNTQLSPVVRSLFFVILACTTLSALAQVPDPQPEPAWPPTKQTVVMPTNAPTESLTAVEIRPPQTLAEGIDLTAPTDDLWVRIRNGYSMPNLNDEVVLTQQQWYTNRPDYLRRMVERSRRYLFYIVEELEKRGMPTELAFLPMVESSFDPMAYSKAHASGLWQFIPATGKRYDLQQNWWHDQRRDILASTGAALEYLQAIYAMNGDWHLALASYNWGENAVKRAVQKNIAKGLPTDFSSLTMPPETRNYVPKLQALKNIFSNPKLFASLNLPELPNRPYFATFEPSRPIDVSIAAKLAGMPLAEFKALNPSHNRPLINANTPLVLPADKLETFQNNLENHTAPLATWQLYTMRSGEKLEKVAPRFGITLEDLKRVNGLQGKLKVTAGSSILVPTKDGQEVAAMPNDIRLPEIVPDSPEPCHSKGERHGKHERSVAGKKGKAACKSAVAAESKTRAEKTTNHGKSKPEKASSKKAGTSSKPAKSGASAASKKPAPATKKRK